MRRLVATIALLMVLDTVAYAAVIPLIPHYRAEFGLSPFGAGVLIASYSAAVLLFALPSGQLSDLLGSKWMTTVGAVALVAGMLLMAIANSFLVLLLARVLQGGADAVVWSAGIAWVSSVSAPEERGGRIGVIQGSGTIGFIAGPVIGAVAISGVGITPTFLALAVLAVGLLVMIALQPQARRVPDVRPALSSMLAACYRQSLITASVILIFVAAVVGGALQLLVTLQLSDSGMSGSGIGAVYTAGAILSSAIAVATGRGGDRYGRVPLAVAGTAVLAAMIATLALPVSERWFVALAILVFGLEAVLYATAYPLSVDGADRSQLGHGVVLGVVNLAWGIGAVLGPLAGSGLGDLTGSNVTYVLLAVFTAAACWYIRATTTLARAGVAR